MCLELQLHHATIDQELQRRERRGRRRKSVQHLSGEICYRHVLGRLGLEWRGNNGQWRVVWNI